MRSSNVGRAAMKAGGLALAITLAPTLSTANDPRAQRGRTFAQANCAQCHARRAHRESPLRMFRTLHKRYPVNPSPRAGRGIVTGHLSVPEFRLDIAQINDLIAYLQSLENRQQ